MLTFDECREIAAREFGEPVAVEGWEDDDACLVTLQCDADDEARGLVEIGRPWMAVRRGTGEIESWPHLDYLDRVRNMRLALSTQRAFPEPVACLGGSNHAMSGPASTLGLSRAP